MPEDLIDRITRLAVSSFDPKEIAVNHSPQKKQPQMATVYFVLNKEESKAAMDSGFLAFSNCLESQSDEEIKDGLDQFMQECISFLEKNKLRGRSRGRK